MPSNHLTFHCPVLLLSSIFLSIKLFSNELGLCLRWPKYWSFTFSISPSNDYSGLISFRIDRFDLLAVQGTLKSLLQHHNLKASILWCSAFFMVQLSHPYMITGKTIALTLQTFVSCGDRVTGSSSPGRCGVWHKSSWRRSPLAPLQSLRYADDTTLSAEVEEELKSLLMRVKEKS